jgi:hypothetical protein
VDGRPYQGEELAEVVQMTTKPTQQVTYYSSRERRIMRRYWRKHAEKMIAAGCPEMAAVWRKRARNG